MSCLTVAVSSVVLLMALVGLLDAGGCCSSANFRSRAESRLQEEPLQLFKLPYTERFLNLQQLSVALPKSVDVVAFALVAATVLKGSSTTSDLSGELRGFA